MKFLLLIGTIVISLNLLTPDEEKVLANGKELYGSKYVICHGLDGKPTPDMQKNYNKKIPDIGPDGRLSSLSDEDIFVLLRGECTDAIMLQKASEIEDDDLEDLIFFIRHDVCKCKYNPEEKNKNNK